MAIFLERALEAGLRIRPGEQRRTAVMAAYAANAIGAVVVGRSVRDALYLANDPTHGKGLAGMYIFSSLAIVVVSYLYARIADRIPRGKLNGASSIFCAFFAAVAWSLLKLGAGPWIYPALYIFIEAMGALVVIQFWTMANDVFHAREAKRLFGLVGGGGTLANVVFGLLVARYATKIGAENLLFIVIAQLGLCAVCARSAAGMTLAATPNQRRQPSRRKGIVLTREGASIWTNEHLKLVAAVAAVSAMAVTIVDFQFKTAAAAVLHKDELAGYFGRFYGLCGVVALAIQIWVTGRVLERYGILASLLPLPAGLALGSSATAAMASPGLFVSSLAKGSDTIFRYTINDASMQLLYVPVAPHVRGRAKAFIDGVLKPSAICLTGFLLLVYKQHVGSTRLLTIAVVLLVGLWVMLLFGARTEYVKSLVESLERRHLDLSAVPLAAQSEATTKALRAALRGEAGGALHAISLLHQAPAADFTAELLQLLRSPDPRLRASAVTQLGAVHAHVASVPPGGSVGFGPRAAPEVRRLLEDPVPEVRAAALVAVCAVEQEDAVPTVSTFLDKAKAPEAIVRSAAMVALIRHAGLDGILAAAEPLRELLAAQDPEDRAVAADALGSIGVRSFYRPLLTFLKDPDYAVRRRAITAAARLKSAELVPALIEAFRHRETLLEVAAALTGYGPGIEDTLGYTLASEGQHLDCRRGAALVLGRLGTRAAAASLIAALPTRSAPVRKAIARALSRLLRRNRDTGVDLAAVERSIRDEVARARAVLAAHKKLGLVTPQRGLAPRTSSELLALALLEERDHRVLQALALLEVLVPSVRLDVVAENLRSDSPAVRGNAIEVLDNSLPDSWKREILAALDETKRRSDEVQPDPRFLAELVAGLVGGECGTWVSACAVQWLRSRPAGLELRTQLAALRAALTAPVASVRQVAAAALAVALAPKEVTVALSPLSEDPAFSVRKTVRLLLAQAAAAPRASA